jgi:hypothetical protein
MALCHILTSNETGQAYRNVISNDFFKLPSNHFKLLTYLIWSDKGLLKKEEKNPKMIR